jgi:hypothetical protein
VLLGPDVRSVTATVSFAEYLAESRVVEGDEVERPRQVWRRYPRPPATVELPLDERRLAHGLEASRRPRKKSPQPPFLKGGLRNEPRSRIVLLAHRLRIWLPLLCQRRGRGEDFSRGCASAEAPDPERPHTVPHPTVVLV